MVFKNFFVRNRTLLLIVTLQLFFFFYLGQVHHKDHGVLFIDLSYFLLLFKVLFLLKAVDLFVSLLNVICFSFLFLSFFFFFFFLMKNV